MSVKDFLVNIIGTLWLLRDPTSEETVTFLFRLDKSLKIEAQYLYSSDEGDTSVMGFAFYQYQGCWFAVYADDDGGSITTKQITNKMIEAGLEKVQLELLEEEM